MGRGELTSREWSLLEPHLPPLGGRGGRWSDYRVVVNGILFRVRTGVPWRDLPERYGSWKTVYERHRRGSADGTWDRILQAVHADADLARGDGSTGRWSASTQRPAGPISTRLAPAKPVRGPREEDDVPAPSPRRGTRTVPGGLTCKIHLAGEDGCRPMALLLTPGQWGDARRWSRTWTEYEIPNCQVDGPAPGRTTSVATRLTAHAVTAVICEDATSGTRSRNRRTSGSTAAAKAAEAADQRPSNATTTRLRLPRHRHRRSDPALTPPAIRRTEPRGCPVTAGRRRDDLAVAGVIAASEPSWMGPSPS